MMDFIKRSDHIVFILLTLLLFLMPIPYGSNRPWALSIAESVMFFMVTVTLFKQLMPAYIATPTPKHVRNISFLFLASIFYQILMILPLPIDLVQLLSEQRFTNHFTTFPQSSNEYLSFSYDRYTAIKTLLVNLSYIALFFATYHIVNSPHKITIVLWIIVISGLAQALYGIIEMFSFQNSILNKEFTRASHTISGSFINRNHFSSFLLYAIGATSALLLTLSPHIRSKSSRLLDYRFHLKIYLLIFVLALLYSQSRGAEIGLVLATFIGLSLFLINNNKKTGRILAFLIFTLPLTIFIFYMASDGWLDRFNYIVDQAPQRLVIWQTSLNIFYDYWLTGVGPGNYQYIYPMYQLFGADYYVDHAHNDYIELLVEQGVIGLILLAAPVIVAFIAIAKYIINHKQRRLSGIQLSMFVTLIAVLIHSSVDFVFQIPVLVAYFYVFLALALRTFNLNNEN